MDTMSEQEKQAILAEQAKRLAEAKSRVAAVDAQPPAEPGLMERAAELLRRLRGKVQNIPPIPAASDKQLRDVPRAAADALPDLLVPRDAIDKLRARDRGDYSR